MKNRDCSSRSQIQLFCKWTFKRKLKTYFHLLLLEKCIRIVIIIIKTLKTLKHIFYPWHIELFGKPAALLAPTGAFPIGTLGDASACWRDRVKIMQRHSPKVTRMAMTCWVSQRQSDAKEYFARTKPGPGVCRAGGGLTPASSWHKHKAGLSLVRLCHPCPLIGWERSWCDWGPCSQCPPALFISHWGALLVSPLWVLRTQQWGLLLLYFPASQCIAMQPENAMQLLQQSENI